MAWSASRLKVGNCTNPVVLDAQEASVEEHRRSRLAIKRKLPGVESASQSASQKRTLRTAPLNSKQHYEENAKDVESDSKPMDEGSTSDENKEVAPSRREPPVTCSGPCAPDQKNGHFEETASCLDFRHLRLRDGHTMCPLWVCPDGRILFESFRPRSAEIADFLIAIAEPICRPEIIHEYQITMLSLNAAVAAGIDVETIIKLLQKLSKNELDAGFLRFIREKAQSTGKLKIVLRNNRHFLEADDVGLLERLMADPVIASSVVDSQSNSVLAPRFGEIGTGTATTEISSLRVEVVKEAAHRMHLPLLQEYEYSQDRSDANPELAINLKASASLRPYQLRALSKMFPFDGVAKSGIVVLPCGAGKTLVGISVCARIKRRTLILTSTAVAVDQWRRQLIEYSTVAPEDIYVLTAEHKRPIEDKERRACVLVSTYSMMGFAGKRSGDSGLILDQIQQLEWGLLVVDEVQMMPARTFRTVATTVKSHCSLGLTATLVREDHLELDLHWLIGPKLYEASWQQLQDDGFLARVRCVEVWCEMSKAFFAEYLRAVDEKDATKRNALWTCNPHKLKVCDYLIRRHEARGDKTIVFSDNIFILEEFAKKLQRYYICGKVDMRERMQILEKFQHSPWCNTIFLSKVGDNAIDIPNANVIIQISSHYGSRRQEAQRLGRILRPKPKSSNTISKFNAFFYSLVSRDTQEMYYASKRQQFLVEQGYNYHVLRDHNVNRMDSENLIFSGEQAQTQLLAQVLESLRRGDATEEGDLALHDPNAAPSTDKSATVDPRSAEVSNGENIQRQAPRVSNNVVEQKVSMASLSGGLDGSYSVTTAFKSKLMKPDGA